MTFLFSDPQNICVDTSFVIFVKLSNLIIELLKRNYGTFTCLVAEILEKKVFPMVANNRMFIYYFLFITAKLS